MERLRRIVSFLRSVEKNRLPISAVISTVTVRIGVSVVSVGTTIAVVSVVSISFRLGFRGSFSFSFTLPVSVSVKKYRKINTKVYGTLGISHQSMRHQPIRTLTHWDIRT